MPLKITGGRPIEILLVEDSPDSAELTMDVLHKGGFATGSTGSKTARTP